MSSYGFRIFTTAGKIGVSRCTTASRRSPASSLARPMLLLPLGFIGEAYGVKSLLLEIQALALPREGNQRQ
jgi:hypothetical protein